MTMACICNVLYHIGCIVYCLLKVLHLYRACCTKTCSVHPIYLQNTIHAPAPNLQNQHPIFCWGSSTGGGFYQVSSPSHLLPLHGRATGRKGTGRCYQYSIVG